MQYTYTYKRKKRNLFRSIALKKGNNILYAVNASEVYKLKRLLYSLILEKPRYMREKLQVHFIYKAYYNGKVTWVSQHIKMVEFSPMGRPIVHQGTISEYNNEYFHGVSTCIVEFTDGKRYCITVSEAGKAEVLFSLNKAQVSILRFACMGYSRTEISSLIQMTTGAVYNSTKEIYTSLGLKNWNLAVNKVMKLAMIWELEGSTVHN